MFQGVTPNQIPARILNKGFYCTSSLPVLYPERGRGRRQTENQSARTSRLEEKNKKFKSEAPFFPPSPVMNRKWSEEKDGGVCFVCLCGREEGYTFGLNQIIINTTWLYQSLKSLQWEELALTWAQKNWSGTGPEPASVPLPTPLGFSTSPPRCSSSSSLTNQTWL